MRELRPAIAAGILASWAVCVAAQPVATPPVGGESAAGLRGLSAGEIEDLREGRGMGLARAADVNGYPGPRHVLDAARAGQLALRPDQQVAVERLFERMSAEARRLGARLLAEERALEEAFRTGAITEAALRARLGPIGALRTELRAVHLRTHLEMRRLLDEDQVRRYQELRGDATGGAAPGHSHH